MATLRLDEPLRTRDAVVDIDGGLPAGIYRVQLVVEGANGRSAPAELRIRVVRGLDPREPVRPGPGPVPGPSPVRPT